jgi:hypothetical protein
MSLTIDFWQLIGSLGALLSVSVTVLLGIARLLLTQFEKRLDAKFATLEQGAKKSEAEWQRVERELMTMRSELPLNYVRRDDYIRNQTIIEGKLDGLAIRIENALLKGERTHG